MSVKRALGCERGADGRARDATHVDANAHVRTRPPIGNVQNANHRDDDDDDLRRAAGVRANLGTRDDDTEHPWRVYRTDRLPRARETMRGTRTRTRTRRRMI